MSSRYMSQAEPLFSVVIPAYKAAGFIRQTLRSVYAQTEQDFEIVVVNDGSPDNTAEVLEQETDPRLRVITQPNGGECAARNRGVREARGVYVAFLDSDDAWLPDHLELARRFFEQHPGYDWFSTRPRRTPEISESDLKISADAHEGYWLVDWYLEGDDQTSSSSAVLRREALDGSDLFPVGVRMFGDGIGWCRFARKHRMMGTSHHTTALYRIWGGSATDTYLANTGGAKAGTALDAFLLQQEMFNNPEFPDEARLFFRKASLYNWWIRARSTSLRGWVDEIRQRRSVNGAFLTAWLLFCAHTSHFFALTMGKIVRLQYNAVERRQKRLAAQSRRFLG